jgi:hypothetical protein
VSPWKRRAVLAAIVAASLAGGAAVTLLWRALHPPPASPSARDLSGVWQTNFGVFVLRVGDAGDAYGVYEHDAGIVIGRYRDGLFIGRWCELPTYRDQQDAGVLQMQFARGSNSNVVDGRWSYGDTPDLVSPTAQTQWHTGQGGFFGEQLDRAAPQALTDRLERREPCK